MTDTVFDISQYETAETGVLEVLNEKEEPLMFNGAPVTIELYGPGSEVHVRAQAELDTANQTRTFAALRGKVPKDAHDEARKGQVKKLAACTKAINNFPITGGAAALYSNPKLGHITAQVVRFLDAWSNFPSASSTT